MAQVSYGTITITDTNDIESIIVEYNRNQSTTTPPAENDSGWSTTRPTWAQGYYIWQRTRIHKSGTQASADIFGTAVCLTGSTGQTGQTGATGQSLSSTKTQYTNVASNVTITTSNHTNYTWTDNVPVYDSSKPVYWGRITNTYINPAKTEYLVYKDQGTTDAITTAAAANSTANTANQTANNAKNKADTVEGNLNSYITSNNNALNALQTKTKYFWTNLVAHTNGSNGWTKPNYPVGTYAASGISGTTFDEENSSTYGYNTLYANGIKLRYNAINLGELTGSSLIFYKPSTTSQGGKAMELSGSALKFYNPTNDSISMMDLTSSGLTFKTAAGATIGTFGSDNSGGLLDLSGRLNIKGGGRIGQDSDNYWEFGDNKSYNDEDSAYLMGKGTASIQLGETGHWRLDRNRIHTGWYQLSDSTAGTIHFDTGADNGTTYYWDYGLHYPNKSGNGNNKFLYVRRSSSSTSTSLSTMKGRIDDDSWWVYKFYVDGDGNIHAKNFFVGDSDTPIGGGTGTIAEKIINSDSTYGKGSATQPIYIDSNGRPALTTYALNAAGAKGVVTDIASNTSSANLPTAAAVVSYVTSRGYKTTDQNVQTSQANDKKIYLTGTQTAGTTTGTLNYDSNIYADTTAGALHATTFNGYTLAAASAKGVDTSLTTSSTSTNLPTSKAVVDLIKQYLPLTGGSITGPVNFGDSVSIDDLTAGNLIVNGSGRFTNGLYGDLIGNADTATKVGNDLKIQLNGGTTEGTNQFTFNGSAAKTVNITKSSIGLGNVENKSSATIRGELTSSNVTTALGFTPYNATNPNGYTTNTGTVTSVKVQGSNGLTGSGTVTTSGTITLSHDDTSSQASSSNSGRTYIQSVTLDGYGHVTGLSTATETVTNTHNTAYLYAGASNGTANATTTNGNTYLILMDGGSATTRRKISGSGTVSVASNASGDITITGSAHPVALNGVSFANGIITFTKTDGNSTTIQTDNFVITQAAGATALVGTDTDHTPLSVNGPVKFTNGVPVTMRPSSASGKFLKDDGTWDTPGGTYSLPLAANGTRGGVQIGYTQSGKNYPVQLSSEKMYVNVPWTDTTYTVATGDSNGQIKVTPSSGNAYNVNVKGLGSNAYTSTAYLPLSGGTMSGNLLGNSTATLGSTANPFHQLVLGGATNATMDATSANPRITFQENTGTQPVHLIYTDLDSYRSPAGLKIVGSPTSGNISSPAWLEVEGTVYAGGFSGPLSGNASTATEFSSNATVTLTGDTTGTSAGSKKSWSVSTTTSRLSFLGRRTTVEKIALNPATDTGFKLSWHISDATSRINDATNSPSFDSGIINVPWDWGGYNGQIAITNTVVTPRMQIRSATHVDNGESASPRYTPNYGAWREVVTATKATQIGSATQPVYVSNTGQITAGTTLGGAAYQAVDYYVKKAGDIMTGNLQMNAQLKTSFKSSIATGSYQAVATTIEALCEELRYSSGVMGSANITTAYTKDNITIPTQWYNFLWVPHRSGGANGAASGDNCNYGSLYLSGMTGSGMYMIRYSSSAIAELKNLYNPPNAVKATQDKNGNDITTKYVTIDTNQTITASQKTFNGAIRWGTSSKYGAAYYDSALEAIVFSFA